MKKELITLNINGDDHEIAVYPWRTLNEVLRDQLHLTGTKLGCGTGDCGACTVLLDGQSVSSCLTLAVEAQGQKITTIEGLALEAAANKDLEKCELDPIQESFIAKGAIQCGFCTPGMIMSTKFLLDHTPKPTEAEIRAGLSGNLCRCTGYNKIVDAIADAAEKISPTK
ncbi:MAG: (2Fe-2S)-binding protein [Deltaproteobacteria bacterium]|nr:(2Fe-2S)-binding protein [Deltaproteobacteria bacterium]